MVFTPYVTGGQWVNGCGCGPNIGGCGCSTLSEVYLPGPVGDIEFVKIAGVTIDPARYRVDDGDRLVAVDPTLVWPVDAGIEFVVSYYRGMAPNELTRSAAGYLAAEFYKSCTRDTSCRLPKRVTQVTRSGTTYEVDPGLFSDGLTKIPEVDALILMLNPNRLKQGSRVVSPDSRRQPRRQTWGRY